MALNLFVDTNVFLSLYAFSEDDIEQLRRLFILSDQGIINFILPQQVIDEFHRNRSIKVAESLKVIQSPPGASAPVMARDLEEFEGFAAAASHFRQAHSRLMKALQQKALDFDFGADKLIRDIFERTKSIEVTTKILEKAERRVKLGNPPGKNGSLGDAVNWECILSVLDFIEDLHFISQDRDYQSPLGSDIFNDFLSEELANSNLSTVHFYPSLRAFIDKNYPKVEIEAFEEVGTLIDDLAKSTSFSQARNIIDQLSATPDFTTRQIERIVLAAESNQHLSQFLFNEDVFAFYSNLQSTYGSRLGGQLKRRFDELLIRLDLELDDHL